MPRTSDPAATARELETDAERYPDERGEILLEAAGQWQYAGDHDRAVGVLERVVALGGEDGEYARTSLADSYLATGRDGDAEAQLAALRDGPPSSPGPCQLAAELLEARGRYVAALSWYDLALSLLTDEERAAAAGPTGWISNASPLLHGRRRVREALGLPPDATDRSAPPLPGEPGAHDPIAALAARAAPGRLLDGGELEELLDEAPGDPPGEVRVLFWRAAQYDEAVRDFPNLLADDLPPTRRAYHDRLERRLRRLSAQGVARLVLLPGSASGLVAFAERTGGERSDEATRRAYTDQVWAEGERVAWPPARNGACWCGSGAKYKKCCGRPANREE